MAAFINSTVSFVVETASLGISGLVSAVYSFPEFIIYGLIPGAVLCSPYAYKKPLKIASTYFATTVMVLWPAVHLYVLDLNKPLNNFKADTDSAKSQLLELGTIGVMLTLLIVGWIAGVLFMWEDWRTRYVSVLIAVVAVSLLSMSHDGKPGLTTFTYLGSTCFSSLVGFYLGWQSMFWVLILGMSSKELVQVISDLYSGQKQMGLLALLMHIAVICAGGYAHFIYSGKPEPASSFTNSNITESRGSIRDSKRSTINKKFDEKETTSLGVNSEKRTSYTSNL